MRGTGPILHYLSSCVKLTRPQREAKPPLFLPVQLALASTSHRLKWYQLPALRLSCTKFSSVRHVPRVSSRNPRDRLGAPHACAAAEDDSTRQGPLGSGCSFARCKRASSNFWRWAASTREVHGEEKATGKWGTPQAKAHPPNGCGKQEERNLGAEILGAGPGAIHRASYVFSFS